MPLPSTPTLLGLPYDGCSSFLRGAAAAPPVIRQALHSPAGNPWTETGIDLGRDGALADMGDVPLGGSSAEVRHKIEESLRTLLDRGGRPIVLGGDHSISYSVIRAVRWFHPRLEVLHIDAHPEMYPEFEGDASSHAWPLARVMAERLADRRLAARPLRRRRQIRPTGLGRVVQARSLACLPAPARVYAVGSAR